MKVTFNKGEPPPSSAPVISQQWYHLDYSPSGSKGIGVVEEIPIPKVATVLKFEAVDDIRL